MNRSVPSEASSSKATVTAIGAIQSWVSQLLQKAEELGVAGIRIPDFDLSLTERELLQMVPGVSPAIKRKLADDNASYSLADLRDLIVPLADNLVTGSAASQVAVLHLVTDLMGRLSNCITGKQEKPSRKGRKSQPRARTTFVYQIKITLRGAKPPIWRRIQVQDCTLDKLHQHIQAAMGWSNSHLHQFTIAGENYGDPELLEDDFGILDSTKTRLSEFTPAEGNKFRFRYEYDFGDGWEHDILIEKCTPAEKGVKYPRCLTGKGACPPEDCGGVWGYADLLKAIANPKHKDHESMLEWLGRRFEPERFDPAQATDNMQTGFPNWRPT